MKDFWTAVVWGAGIYVGMALVDTALKARAAIIKAKHKPSAPSGNGEEPK
jgi:hypothetical protein